MRTLISRRSVSAVFVTLFAVVNFSRAFYLPGLAPVNFCTKEEKAQTDINGNKPECQVILMFYQLNFN